MPRALALIAAIALGGCAVAGETDSATARSAPAARTAGANAQLSLITEPAAGIASLLAAIRGAHRSVELVMYEDEDAQVDSALASAHARGVKVQVLLNGGYYGGGSSDNEPAYRYLKTHGVAVRWTPRYFALTHQKSLVVDGRAYILTFNLTPQYYSSDRDFGVIDRDAADVSAIERIFAADWARTRITAPNGHDLIWSPGSQHALTALIDSAGGYVDVYNEEMDSAPVEQALEGAARRGVQVRVVMTYDSEWRDAFDALTSAGVRVRTYASDASLYVHAKMILTPHRAFIGSENFSYTSLESNRELGISLTTPALLGSLRATFDRDYSRAQAFRASASLAPGARIAGPVRARSSVGERSLHTREVAGSSPAVPIAPRLARSRGFCVLGGCPAETTGMPKARASRRRCPPRKSSRREMTGGATPRRASTSPRSPTICPREWCSACLRASTRPSGLIP